MKRMIAFLMAMCLAMGVMPGIAEDETAAIIYQFGDTGDDVLALQTRLQELLYYDGPLSGNFKERTRAAVMAVQAAYGLEQTGIADAATLAIIFDVCYRPLKNGSRGADVERLQKRLIELGYYTGNVSGNYLTGTTAGIEAFQRMYNLPVTGMADVITQQRLYDHTLPTMPPTPTPTPTPTPSPTPEPDLSFKGKLQYGSTGSRVKTLQERLKTLGFFEGKTTTGFYAKTQQAVRDFQKHNALTVDGVAGEETWGLIFSDTAVPASATPSPTHIPTPAPYFMEVDVVNQVTKVYGLDENGEYTIPVRYMICSTGTKSNPSDVGYWTINGYHVPWSYFPQWGSHAQYWTRINSNIAFHSVIYNSPDPMDLSISSYNKLGQRASHGCIRLTVADAKWVYDNIKKGVVVWIHETGKADPELVASLKPASLNKKNMLPYVTPTPTPAPVYISDGMPPMPLRLMKNGSSGADVYWLQMKLKELGYYAGTVTGTYLGGTVSAVKAFQRANGLSVDGEAGVRTLNLLYADVLATPSPSGTTSDTPTATEPIATPAPTKRPVSTPTKAPSDGGGYYKR